MLGLNLRARTLRSNLVWIFPAVLVLGGCSTLEKGAFEPVGNALRSVGQVFKDPRERYITGVASDVCVSHREPFVEVLEKQKTQIKKWAAIGAAVGGSIGAAADENNRLRGTVIGIVTGAFAGAMIGYYADLKERSKNTDGLRKTVFSNARTDVKGSDRLVSGVEQLNRCRMGELQKVANGLQKGTLSKEDARTRLSDIKFSTSEDNALIESVSSGLRKRADIYVNALKLSGAEDADAYIKKAESYKPVVKKPQFTAARARTTPVSLPKRSKKGENGIAGVVKNSAELDALHTAHLEAVDEGITDIETLLL